jgi:hypothetical protein
MAVDMPDALVYVVGASDTPSAPLLTELENYSKTRLPIRYQWVDSRSLPEVEAVPGKRVEFLVHDSSRFDLIKKASAIPADELSQLSWFLQDFSAVGGPESSIYPTQGDMRLVQLGTLVTRTMAFLLIGLFFYMIYTVYTAMDSKAWQLAPEEVVRSEKLLQKLSAEDQLVKYTNGLVLPRSKGWLVMDMLLDTFTGKPGIRVESFEYKIAPLAAKAAPKGAPKGASESKIGWVRTWTIKGFAQASASSELEKLNSEKGITDLFQKFYLSSGDPTAEVVDIASRSIEVSINQSTNNAYQRGLDPKKQARDSSAAYPVVFDAIITQTFDSKDKIAMDSKKPTPSL